VNGSLSILHCLNAPIGGLFRHVCDLATAQAEMGHNVGIVCDARPAGDNAENMLRNLEENVCALGVLRIRMSRRPGLRDLFASRAIREIAIQAQAQVLHGHGAKGGACARLAASSLKKKDHRIAAFYTPHAGSLHYDPASLQSRLFMAMERQLAPKTDGLIFQSAFGAHLYHMKVGPFPCEMRIIPNGLRREGFYSAILDENAAEFVFVGELRQLKGVDVFLEALARLAAKHDIRAFIAGGGPHAGKFQKLAKKLGLEAKVTFAGPTPAHAAFARGRCLVVPSRAESLPYVVLEAAAACLPFIATDVGGIPEIVKDSDVALVPVGDAEALAVEMRNFLEHPQIYVDRAAKLQEIVAKRFSVDGMARAITHFYISRLMETNAGYND
jgi:glycosyltransferase involved in cell wall biosynthesis